MVLILDQVIMEVKYFRVIIEAFIKMLINFIKDTNNNYKDINFNFIINTLDIMQFNNLLLNPLFYFVEDFYFNDNILL